MITLPSPNFDARPTPPDLLVLHYTGMQSAQAAIDRLRDPESRVSSHYVVDEDGTLYCLVEEEFACVARWRILLARAPGAERHLHRRRNRQSGP